MAKNLTPRGFVVGHKRADDDCAPNFTVDSLFTAFITKQLNLRKLSFKKSILQAALTAFGVESFTDWCRNQTTSPALSELHADFIKDTINFITGHERKYDLTTWDSIISRSNVPTNTRIELERPTFDSLEDFFGVSNGGVYRVHKANFLEDVLVQWTSREDGFADLIYTLYILFGSCPKPNAKVTTM